VGQAVGVNVGFDDGAVVGESVYDGGAQAGSVKVSVQPEKGSRPPGFPGTSGSVVPVIDLGQEEQVGCSPSQGRTGRERWLW